jgi:maleylpyruvate isomerase
VEKSDTGRDLDRDVAGCAAAHQRLLADLDGLSEEQARQPSLLPGWSVGHVLTHIARNADGLTGMFQAADRGDIAAQYPSVDARADDIEAGSGRSAEALVHDVRMSIWRLESAWAGVSAQGWAGNGRTVDGLVPIVNLPMRRWAEVDIHHLDLGLGYTADQWPAEFVRLELRRQTMQWASRRSMGMTELPQQAKALPDTTRLLWLLGRLDVAGLPSPGNV